MTPVRCAIYTRKSSDEGLEQGFNSLHAQRDACAAYILSQASEGWQLVPEHYDDGGISGGTLERPALQTLLADVAAGKIDIIVVYKVDRLTRSLLDFARLVEMLDKAGVSFVSITQAFNTTTSMGRLTLNMLLSFAQFEREVTAERIRDKLAASKAKGMWMGGVPPLGYKPDGRSLTIVEEHASFVRDIFKRYRTLGNVRLVEEQLTEEGITVPQRTTGTGRALGGGFFSRGQLYAILKNPIYVGDIAHHETIHPGNHPAIIEREEWDKVQRQLVSHTKGKRVQRAPTNSPLACLIVDQAGEPLVATHTRKGEQRYRYYVSKALHHGTGEGSGGGIRLPAKEVDQVVAQELAALFDDPMHLAELAGLDLQPAALIPLVARCKEVGPKLQSSSSSLLQRLLVKVQVHAASLDLVVSAASLSKLVDVPLAGHAPEHFTLTSNVRLTRTGRAVRLVQNNGALAAPTTGADPALLRLLVKARGWWDILAEGKLDTPSLAKQEGVTRSYITRVVRLAFLAPSVVEGILAGRTKAGIDAQALLRADAFGWDWEEQEKALLVF
ncbi:recombinase family protein [Altericroceibacterium xinjiangense]|uniref:recombinase family protein n=1 Tax=Altericroceibacterium xinjiangense TaxID=762261 RepID=UPI000F7F3C07|nr:recombinase family protein [Altericroceibacterium xinjiangense]